MRAEKVHDVRGGTTGDPVTSLKMTAAAKCNRVRSFISDALRSRREKSVPTVWVSNRQPLQGETVAVRVSVPPPATPVGHLHNFLRCKFGGGLVSMSVEEEPEDVRGVRVKSVPVFRDGPDRQGFFITRTRASESFSPSGNDRMFGTPVTRKKKKKTNVRSPSTTQYSRALWSFGSKFWQKKVGMCM